MLLILQTTRRAWLQAPPPIQWSHSSLSVTAGDLHHISILVFFLVLDNSSLIFFSTKTVSRSCQKPIPLYGTGSYVTLAGSETLGCQQWPELLHLPSTVVTDFHHHVWLEASPHTFHGNKASLCSPGWREIPCRDQADPKLIEIQLSPPLECWD